MRNDGVKLEMARLCSGASGRARRARTPVNDTNKNGREGKVRLSYFGATLDRRRHLPKCGTEATTDTATMNI